MSLDMKLYLCQQVMSQTAEQKVAVIRSLLAANLPSDILHLFVATIVAPQEMKMFGGPR